MKQRNSENKDLKESVEKEFEETQDQFVQPIKSNDLIESKDLITDDNLLYNAEVIAKFGKTSVGSKIQKKGSILKVLLDKKLIKLI